MDINWMEILDRRGSNFYYAHSHWWMEILSKTEQRLFFNWPVISHYSNNRLLVFYIYTMGKCTTHMRQAQQQFTFLAFTHSLCLSYNTIRNFNRAINKKLERQDSWFRKPCECRQVDRHCWKNYNIDLRYAKPIFSHRFINSSEGHNKI